MKRRRRFPMRRRFRAPLARKRRTWVTGLRSGCTIQAVDWFPNGETCETAFKLVLFDNSLLETGFSDRCTIRRIVGDIWFFPTLDYARAATPEQLYTLLAGEGNQFLHCGLLNLELMRDQAGNLATGNSFPVTSDFDYSESQWMKTWQHFWAVTDGINGFTLENIATDAQANFPSTVNDTHTHVGGVEACNELVTGSGFICIETDTSHECVTCDQPSGLSTESLQVAIPKKWNLHLDIKKRIPMRENNELILNCDWAIPDVVVPQGGWFMGVYPMLKVLVEMG